MVSYIWKLRLCWILKYVVFCLGPATGDGNLALRGEKVHSCGFFYIMSRRSRKQELIYLGMLKKKGITHSLTWNLNSLVLWEPCNKKHVPLAVLALKMAHWAPFSSLWRLVLCLWSWRPWTMCRYMCRIFRRRSIGQPFFWCQCEKK